MDNFLKRLKEEIMVLHQKIGVLNRPQNQFIWVRTYKDRAEFETKTTEFKAADVKLGGNVAKKEVREFESRLCISGFARRESLADC